MSRPSWSFRDRYLDVLASVYIYNEHRGYTALDRVLEAVRACHPDDHEFIARIEKHRGDEYKHYHMFRRWFERRGTMPLALDRRVGHIDRFIFKAFGCEIDELDTDGIIARPEDFETLCRVIVLTEQRGLRQVEVLLKNAHVLSDPVMKRIFTIVHKDEPDHYEPYAEWLERTGRQGPRFREKLTDFWIHRALLFGHIPAIFLDPGLPRMERWPHEEDAPGSAPADLQTEAA
ncbi:MAG: ferritin-like domain-containing protein [Novosphingobium sp.]